MIVFFNIDHLGMRTVPGNAIKYTLESRFYIEKLHISEEVLAFNAGVLVFHLNDWHRQGITHMVTEIADQYPRELLSCDQTLLNAVWRGDFTQLPGKFNKSYFPHDQADYATFNGILHFVGSPKPWDIGARFVHSGYQTWSNYDTAFWKLHYGKFTSGKMRRLWNIRRSYLKYLWNKVKK